MVPIFFEVVAPESLIIFESVCNPRLLIDVAGLERLSLVRISLARVIILFTLLNVRAVSIHVEMAKVRIKLLDFGSLSRLYGMILISCFPCSSSLGPIELIVRSLQAYIVLDSG